MTTRGTIRRGLPHFTSGEPWPPEAEYVLEALETGATLSDPLQLQPRSADGGAPSAPAAQEPADAAPSGEEPAAPVESIPGVPLPDSQTTPLRALGEPVVTEYEAPLRRGLPRVAGGEAWPSAGTGTMRVVLPAGTALDVTHDHVGSPDAAAAAQAPVAAAATAAAVAPAAASFAAAATSESDRVTEAEVALRRGLPREAGGDPWPPAGTGTLRTVVPAGSGLANADEAAAEAVTVESVTDEAVAEAPAAPVEPAVPAEPVAAPAADLAPGAVSAPAIPAQAASAPAAQPSASLAQEATAAAQQAAIAAQEAARAAQQAAAAAAEVAVAARQLAAVAEQTSAAAAQQPSGWRRWSKRGRRAGKSDSGSESDKRAFTTKIVIAGVIAAVVAVAAVLIVRALLATEPLQEFLTRYPGEYHLPETAEPGFPAWAKWTHFLNFFFMVQIVRSGLQVRTQKKPDAYWTPKWSKNGEGKISLALWFHQSLDILWLLNGVIFVVLLFASGHWMRIVPTSWEVFPNMVSAMLQYISFDWPVEDGWVNYNSLQQLMYFIVVFIAAPLAAVSGFRMSGMWSKKWKRLSEIYPIEVARAIHFPTMLFFVFFVIVHVILVFTTGALKNLNHMFGEGPVVSWVGLGFFALGVAVVAGVWVAARPLILAPIASLFGRVSNR